MVSKYMYIGKASVTYYKGSQESVSNLVGQKS